MPLVPVPLRVSRTRGPGFRIDPGTRVVVGHEPSTISTGVLVAARIGEVCGFPVEVVHVDDGRPGAVILRRTDDAAYLDLPADADRALAQDAYRLEVTADRVVITAVGDAGLMYGALTLQQLGEHGPHGTVTVRAAVVVDHPRFGWRGLSLDVARHFHGVETVKKVVNVMASLKLNVLHLHLTDDQGWRLEIPSRPGLTARSGGTAVDGDPGGWYSVEEFDEIVAYAATRFITVIPEIDIPGHINAALHAYGELTPSGEPAPAYTGIEVGFSRLHEELPATARFLRDVLGDVARMTPGRFVHIGGDEVLSMERGEYARLVGTAASQVAAAGKTVVAWQEAATVPLAPGTVLQYWDEREGAQEMAAAARAGALVVLSPASKVYLDMKYDASTPVGLDWAGHVELRDAYEWEPLEVLPDVPADRVLGVEAGLWTETVRTVDDLFLLLLPRLAAVAEVAWSAPGHRDWDGFTTRVAGLAPRWDESGVAWYASPQVEW
ncbi:family 20 glycosylhydrolase [Actinotalea sp. K2]|uniref:family 20 glycosylhydrolase n=1 Tax=Actinotalea sp. K2 TaxID=2939438 RepID=UPI002016A872|nr:family 20 glycosylhydrolase [Actinotalea sp. K2]MCL3861259.1 beta-N-acetylhexosaminidase [Actinotalea sp. K2]